jgi:hypothetical protein
MFKVIEQENFLQQLKIEKEKNPYIYIYIYMDVVN